MVELRDVQMQFEEKKVLDGFSLKVEPQERLVIMGQKRQWQEHDFAADCGDAPAQCRLDFFQAI